MSRSKFEDLVRAAGGTKPWLDRTKSEHNGVGYRLFKIMLRVKVSYNSMHKLMNLSRPKIHVLEKIDKEQK